MPLLGVVALGVGGVASSGQAGLGRGDEPLGVGDADAGDRLLDAFVFDDHARDVQGVGLGLAALEREASCLTQDALSTEVDRPSLTRLLTREITGEKLVERARAGFGVEAFGHPSSWRVERGALKFNAEGSRAFPTGRRRCRLMMAERRLHLHHGSPRLTDKSNMLTSATSFADYADAMEGALALDPRLTSTVPEPYEALRSIVSLEELRRRGTFFTSHEIATRLWENVGNTLISGSVVVDPACGAGDLLLPALERLRSNQATGFILRGGDLDPDFVRVASARLSRLIPDGAGSIDVRTQDFLSNPGLLEGASHVVLNPPFVPMTVSTGWAAGKVNSAAAFTLAALDNMNPGTHLLAVLPDVLRSGSRYRRWRDEVGKRSVVSRIVPLGQFDKETDVHVFILEAIKSAADQHHPWPNAPVTDGSSVEDLFHIRVGPVVPHRHAESGEDVSYVTARSLTSGVQLRRRFAGRLEKGPLVLVNRTSRPGEFPRARARLYSDPSPLAVENHLIIAAPRDGALETCQALVEVLHSEEAAKYLDQAIRCRHLTVGAVKGIPWPT